MKARESELPAAGDRTRPGLILALACAAQFMVVLDLVVVNVALPTMQKDLHLSSPGLQWVVISYGLAFGGFLLLGGRAADLLGRRNVLVAGFTMFTAGSLAAGLAGSLPPLLVARAVQGLGAAMVAPAALSVLTGTFAEGPARNRALGIFGGVAGSAACLGLVVSGILVGGPGWRWIFLVNVPIGLALATFVLTCVPKGERAHRGPADVLGAVTVTTGVLGIVYAVNKSAGYGWTSPATLGVLAGGAAMLGLFAIAARVVARIGAALGLAIIATAALARSGQVMHADGSQTAVRALAQTAGFQRGALVAAGFSLAAALAAGLLLRRAERIAASARPQETTPEPALRAA